MAGNKPVSKIFLKSKTGNEFVDVCVGWPGRRPGMNPIDYSIDSKIVSITVAKQDGTIVVINPKDYWCNVRNESGAAPAKAQHRTIDARNADSDDEIPF